jgi:hypothetical protein
VSEHVPPQPPEQPVPAPTPPPAAPPASDLDRAIADFDARERDRVAQVRPVLTPFSLRDVDRRVWIAVGVVLALIAVGIGGPPWQASFWITLGLIALVSLPFAIAAAFLWQRERH